MGQEFRFVDGLPPVNRLLTENVSGKRHYVLPDGNKLPSVTTVLSHFKRASLKKWRDRVGETEAKKISAKAAYRGTTIHDLFEKYLRNSLKASDIKNLSLVDKQTLLSCLDTINLIDNIHYIEETFHSVGLGVAGRTDVIAEYDGVLSVIDFKTSLREKREEWITDYFEQATAYSIMYEEHVGKKIDQLVVIIACDDLVEPQVFIKEPKNYEQSLRSKIAEYKNTSGR